MRLWFGAPPLRVPCIFEQVRRRSGFQYPRRSCNLSGQTSRSIRGLVLRKPTAIPALPAGLLVHRPRPQDKYRNNKVEHSPQLACARLPRTPVLCHIPRRKAGLGVFTRVCAIPASVEAVDGCPTRLAHLLLVRAGVCVRRDRTLPQHLRSHSRCPRRSSFRAYARSSIQTADRVVGTLRYSAPSPTPARTTCRPQVRFTHHPARRSACRRTTHRSLRALRLPTLTHSRPWCTLASQASLSLSMPPGMAPHRTRCTLPTPMAILNHTCTGLHLMAHHLHRRRKACPPVHPQ